MSGGDLQQPRDNARARERQRWMNFSEGEWDGELPNAQVHFKAAKLHSFPTHSTLDGELASGLASSRLPRFLLTGHQFFTAEDAESVAASV
jgi:hypothetical protein